MPGPVKAGGPLPTSVRRRATKNLKAWDDLEKQDLGNAQRQAAQALEDLIGRNLQGSWPRKAGAGLEGCEISDRQIVRCRSGVGWEQFLS